MQYGSIFNYFCILFLFVIYYYLIQLITINYILILFITTYYLAEIDGIDFIEIENKLI